MNIRPGSGDESYLHVAVPDFDVEYVQSVTWLSEGLLVTPLAAGTVDEPARLVRDVECCDTDGDVASQQKQLDQLRRYGGLLFDAAFKGIWQELLAAVVRTDADYLEVAVWGAADDDHAALQALRWEALYDGTGFVAAQGTTYQGRDIYVGVVRLIAPSGAWPGNGAAEGVAEGTGLPKITHIPKVLFAVGSHLTDRNVRSGAEFMGIMRRLDRDGGSIQARLLESTTGAKLADELKKFKPDVLHLIGHGQRRSDGQVEVRIRREPDGPDGLSADRLLNIFAAAGHWPTMAVLSVCQTASPGIGADSAPGAAPERVSAGSFAARLVAGNGVAGQGAARGVPVVAAMGGDISDTACRVFTLALTTSIQHGIQLGKAAALGRGAAFYGGPGPASGHWVMPTLFLADRVGEDARLVNTARAVAARRRVEDLDMAMNHVFCGRAPFMTAADRLLDGGDPLNVLVAYTPEQYKSFGGTGLLKELGARAIRADVLPVLLKFGRTPPKNLADLTRGFETCIDEIRLDLGLRERVGRTVAAADGDLLGLAKAIRSDLDALVGDLPEDDPIRHRGAGQPRAILLCRRVDEWIDVLDDLLELLGPHGLRAGASRVPVVLTGADVHQLKTARETKLAWPTWIEFLRLDRFSKASDEDILAYTWWLLNPPANERVYAPKRGASDGWRDLLRLHLEVQGAPLYPARALYAWVKVARDYFISDNDDAMLASYAKVMLASNAKVVP